MMELAEQNVEDAEIPVYSAIYGDAIA